MYIGNIVCSSDATLGAIALRSLLRVVVGVCMGYVRVDANITTFLRLERECPVTPVSFDRAPQSSRLFDANYKTDYKNNGLWRDQVNKIIRAANRVYACVLFVSSHVLLERHVEHQTDVAHLVTGEIFENGYQVEQFVVVRVGEPTADRDGVLRVENVRSGRVVDDDCVLEIASDL